jgi:hypothetical protein
VGTGAVVAHREKYELLGAIANEWADRIVEDHAELDAQGYTSAGRGRAFAALTEAMLAEQYAILDGLRRAIYSVYRGVRGIQNKSTLTLFERAAKEKYGPEFPSAFSVALAQAFSSWFPLLRRVRTLTTHGETGTCHMDRETRVIRYLHLADLRSGGSEVRIDDFVQWGNDTYLVIISLTEKFFEVWFSALASIERRHVCGVYRGRMYERMVAPSVDLSFGDGRCWSRPWFETEDGFECPMSDRCAAYHRPVAQAERDAYFQKAHPGANVGVA